jgi:hypothetical protein
MGEVDVYAEPSRSSQVVTTMTVGDYAAVIGRMGERWVRVDLGVGNTGLDLRGWIEETTINLNGPCEDLPTVDRE